MRWIKAGPHSGGAIGPGCLLATTSEVSTSFDRLRQSATFDFEEREVFGEHARNEAPLSVEHCHVHFDQ